MPTFTHDDKASGKEQSDETVVPEDAFSLAANRPQKGRRTGSAGAAGSAKSSRSGSGLLSPGLDALVEALRVQPGIGPRSAQRIAFHLLQHDRDGASALGHALLNAVNHVRHCSLCNNFTQTEICDVCLDDTRDMSMLCVVEMPTDQMLIEQTRTFHGRYFVLMGHLSPLDGIGPKDLQMDKLIQRAQDGQVKEVVLATNFSNEGEATAYYVSEILKSKGLKVSRLARGVPAGAELEYVDAGTLARAMLDRRQH